MWSTYAGNGEHVLENLLVASKLDGAVHVIELRVRHSTSDSVEADLRGKERHDILQHEEKDERV